MLPGGRFAHYDYQIPIRASTCFLIRENVSTRSRGSICLAHRYPVAAGNQIPVESRISPICPMSTGYPMFNPLASSPLSLEVIDQTR